MSHAPLADDDSGVSLRPRPRRPFELSSQPASPSGTPPLDSQYLANQLQPGSAQDGSSTPLGSAPSRTRSILNLTSSTLFGIYSPTGYANDREEPSTPWGTGAETPVDTSPKASLDIPDTILFNGPNGLKRRRRSTAVPRNSFHQPRKGLKGYYLPLLGRTLALSGVGVLYGLLISHLHDRQDIAPVKVDGIDRSDWPYYVFWGIAGALIGQALPYFDSVWAGDDDDVEELEDYKTKRDRPGMVGWNHVVRSVGAFVGIAYAIRKLPWQSTLQLSLTVALANPAIWYVIDRSPPGFIMSAVVAISGTGVLLGINPALVPPPSPHQSVQSHAGKQANTTGVPVVNEELVLGLFSHESVGVATWIASVLFVSCVCFGNIGRKLAPQQK